MSYKNAKICQYVNSGCIVIGEYPACDSDWSEIHVDSGSVTIYAKFSGDKVNKYENSGCVLNAVWPSYYGDIFFGADNCLYDTTGEYLHHFLRE